MFFKDDSNPHLNDFETVRIDRTDGYGDAGIDTEFIHIEHIRYSRRSNKPILFMDDINVAWGLGNTY